MAIMKNDFIISQEQIKDISYNLEATYLTIFCLIPLGIVRMMSLRGLGVVVCTVAKDPKSLSTTAEEESQPTNGNMYAKVIAARIRLNFLCLKLSKSNLDQSIALTQTDGARFCISSYQTTIVDNAQFDQRLQKVMSY